MSRRLPAAAGLINSQIQVREEARVEFSAKAMNYGESALQGAC